MFKFALCRFCKLLLAASNLGNEDSILETTGLLLTTHITTLCYHILVHKILQKFQAQYD